MKLVTSALGRWGFRWVHLSTSAKVQIIFERCKRGALSDLGRTCPPLTDVFFTKLVLVGG